MIMWIDHGLDISDYQENKVTKILSEYMHIAANEFITHNKDY